VLTTAVAAEMVVVMVAVTATTIKHQPSISQ
jgi:hypothetical protein